MPGSLSQTSIFGTPPSPASSCHIPATRSPACLEGSSNAMMNPEYAATIVRTGGLVSTFRATGTTSPGNHRSHCTISPAAYVVRSAGSGGLNNGRSNATRARNTDEECSHPIRSAITDAGISGKPVNNRRIAGSNSSTREPRGAREYFGGASAANAERTVFLANPNRRAIALTPTCSDRFNRRISAQSSTLITPSLWTEGGSTFARHQGVSVHSASTGAAIFFAASKAGRDIRLHTASGGRRVRRCPPKSTRIPWQRLRSPCGHERQRPSLPEGEKGPLTCDFTCSGGRI